MRSEIGGSCGIVTEKPQHNLVEELRQILAKISRGQKELMQTFMKIKMCCLLSKYDYSIQAHVQALQFNSSGSNDSCLNK